MWQPSGDSRLVARGGCEAECGEATRRPGSSECGEATRRPGSSEITINMTLSSAADRPPSPDTPSHPSISPYGTGCHTSTQTRLYPIAPAPASLMGSLVGQAHDEEAVARLAVLSAPCTVILDRMGDDHHRALTRRAALRTTALACSTARPHPGDWQGRCSTCCRGLARPVSGTRADTCARRRRSP
jgi:hypothetical protein